jgi:hypothetical protein
MGTAVRAVDSELHWLVTLGENTPGACERADFRDVIPPEEYGGLESPLGVLGFSRTYRCYGAQLTLHAVLQSAHGKTSTRTSATKRAVILCGKFRPS